MSGSVFFTTLSESLVILRRIQQDIFINMHTSVCKVHLILSDFNQIQNLSTDFLKILKYQILQKIHRVGTEFLRADRQTTEGRKTGKRDEDNGPFSQFVNVPKN